MEETMLNKRFGIEIELTGITRSEAAQVLAKHFETTSYHQGGSYDKSTVEDSQGRTWTIASDSSISREATRPGRMATSDYAVELVSPILTYRADIETLQELVRKLKKAGGKTNSSCGIHIHLDGADHNAKSIRNFVNIIASRDDLLYKSLQIDSNRAGYCKKLTDGLVTRIKGAATLDQIRTAWYAEYYDGYEGSHYHNSRYHFLNLHSFFNGHHTVELRGFNSTLHAGKVRSYIALALGLNGQALTQKAATSRAPQTENEKFSMRTYLNRLGLTGAEFAACREHLCKHLNGCAAWRFGRAA